MRARLIAALLSILLVLPPPPAVASPLLPTTGGNVTGPLTLPITGSTQCLQVNTTGLISGSGAVCGGGGGSGVTSIAASAGLAPTYGTCGGTLSSAGALIGQTCVDAQSGTSYTVTDGDNGKLVTVSNAANVAVTLPQAGTGGAFLTGWRTWVENTGTSVATITPTTSTIDGAASVSIRPNHGVLVVSNGTNYVTVRGNPRVTVESTISSAQAPGVSNCGALYVLTAAATITLPQTSTLTAGCIFGVNAKSGAATIAVNGADQYDGGTAGVGITFPIGTWALITTDAAGHWWSYASNSVTTPARHGSAAVALSGITDRVIYTCNSSDAGCTTGTWSASATWTLPPAPADGTPVEIWDQAGVITNVNTLSIAPGGGDTIAQSASPFVFNAAGARAYLRYSLVAHDWVIAPSIPTATAGWLLVGQGVSNAPAFQAISGDLSLAANGTASVTSVHGVTYPAYSGTNIVPVMTGVNTITYEAVPLAAMATMPNLTLLGNVTGSTTSPAQISLGSLLDAAYGSTTGGLLMRAGGGWQALASGAAGSCLLGGGAGVIPAYGTCPSGGSGVTSLTVVQGLTTSPGTEGGTLSSAGTVSGQMFPHDYSTAATVNVVDADGGRMVRFSNAAGASVVLPQAGAAGAMLSGWRTFLKNDGAGSASLSATVSTIDGSGSPLSIASGAGVIIESDGTNYHSWGGSGGTPPAIPTGYFQGMVMGNHPTITSAVTIDPGQVADSTGATYIKLASQCTVDLTVSGIGGLDVAPGIPAAVSTWYGYFVASGGSGVGCIASPMTNSFIPGISTTAGSTTITFAASHTILPGTVFSLSIGASLYVDRTIVSGAGTTYVVDLPMPTTQSGVGTTFYTFANGGGPTLPAGYNSYYRLVGETQTQAGSAIPVAFHQVEDTVYLDNPTMDLNNTVTTSGLGKQFVVPNGISVYPILRIGAASAIGIDVEPMSTPLIVPTGTTNYNVTGGTDFTTAAGGFIAGRATDYDMRLRIVTSSAGGVTVTGTNVGWTYRRYRR